jgi:Fe-S-cluster containining protein
MMNPISKMVLMPCKNSLERQEDFFGTCSRCKTNYSCCNDTTPPITGERREIIEAYLRKEKIPVKDAFVETGYVFPRLVEQGYCVFNDKRTRKCLIHAVKPETCVAGPITFDINVRNRKIEWFIKKESICQLAGVVYEDKKRLARHLGSAKTEILRLVRGLDGKALKAILAKDEPETLKIGEDEISRDVLDKLVEK